MPRQPACKPIEVIRALQSAGFVLDHSTRAHQFFRHPSRAGMLLSSFIVKILSEALKNIIEQAGLTTEKFINLL
jgi:predicted RNA binding protein YcfA (HicA-like mRNA interferase family)